MNLAYFIDNFDTLTYDEYSKGLTMCLKIIRRNQDVDSTRNELAKIRTTVHEQQLKLYEDFGVFKISEPLNITNEETQILEKYSFYTKDTHHFLLKNRFLIEVNDASGRLITVIGWYPDQRKYITIATRYFSKQIDWFNIDDALDLSLNYFDGTVFVVEGIFDALALRSLGLPVIATMGASVGTVKGKTLTLFKKVVSIPDGDEAGMKALSTWSLPRDSVKVKLDLSIKVRATSVDEQGNEQIKLEDLKIKDPDNLVSLLDFSGVRANLLEVSKTHNPIVIIS